MSISGKEITIAITVFNRRNYLKQAIGSALGQTIPVNVMVIEDCGPDPDLQNFVKEQFGNRVEYIRNPTRRGLFDNWNACIEHCHTPWLSILHDDDYLSPRFAEAMITLSHQAPDCGLYFGQTQMVNEINERIREGMREPMTTTWRRVELTDCIENTPFPYAGQLFRVDYARALGGFRATSQFAGDWEMWCQLLADYGAAQTSEWVAFCRTHGGAERGTSKITRNGRLRPLVFIQQKRVLAQIRQKGGDACFDRREFLRRSPMSVTYLIRYSEGLTTRMLRYNVGLLLRSKSPSIQHKLFQIATKVFGVAFVRTMSRFYRLMRKA
jgi:hypothetical protein